MTEDAKILEPVPKPDHPRPKPTEIEIKPAAESAQARRWEKFENGSISVTAWTDTSDGQPESAENLQKLIRDENTITVYFGGGLASDSSQLDHENVSLVKTIIEQFRANPALKDKKLVIVGVSLPGNPGTQFRNDYSPNIADVRPEEFAQVVDDIAANLGSTPDRTVVAGHSSGGEMVFHLADKYGVVALHPAVGAHDTQNIFSQLDLAEGAGSFFRKIGFGKVVSTFEAGILRDRVSDETIVDTPDMDDQIQMHLRCKHANETAYRLKLDELAEIDVNPLDLIQNAVIKPRLLASHGHDRLTQQAATEKFIGTMKGKNVKVQITAAPQTATNVIDADPNYNYGHDAPFVLQEAADAAAQAIVDQIIAVNAFYAAQKTAEIVRPALTETAPAPTPEIPAQLPAEKPKPTPQTETVVLPEDRAHNQEYAQQLFEDMVTHISQLLDVTGTELNLNFRPADDFTPAGLNRLLSECGKIKPDQLDKYLDNVDGQGNSLFYSLQMIETTLAWKYALQLAKSQAPANVVADAAFNTVSLWPTMKMIYRELNPGQTMPERDLTLTDIPPAQKYATLDQFPTVQTEAVASDYIFNVHRHFGGPFQVVSHASKFENENLLMDVKFLVSYALQFRNTPMRFPNLDAIGKNYEKSLQALDEELANRMKYPIDLHTQDFNWISYLIEKAPKL